MTSRSLLLAIAATLPGCGPTVEEEGLDLVGDWWFEDLATTRDLESEPVVVCVRVRHHLALRSDGSFERLVQWEDHPFDACEEAPEVYEAVASGDWVLVELSSSDRATLLALEVDRVEALQGEFPEGRFDLQLLPGSFVDFVATGRDPGGARFLYLPTIGTFWEGEP